MNSAIVPTKVLTDPVELDRALQSGLQTQPYLDPTSGGFAPDPFQPSMDIIPPEAARVMSLATCDSVLPPPPPPTVVVEVTETDSGAAAAQHNIALPLPEPVDVVKTQQMIVSGDDVTNQPQVSIVPASAVMPGATAATATSGGQKVTLVTNDADPDHVSIVVNAPSSPVDPIPEEEPDNQRKASKKKRNSTKGSNTRENSLARSKKSRKNSSASDEADASSEAVSAATTVDLASKEVGVVVVNHDDEAVLPEKEAYTIELQKDEKGLGITVAGYICEKGILLDIRSKTRKLNFFFAFFFFCC